MLLLVALAAASTPIVRLDFEADDGGCVAGGDTAQWSWGAVVGGPGAAYSGSAAWALDLGGGYLNDTTDTLTCPPVDLSGAARPVLTFAQWYDLDAGDLASVEVDDGSGFRRMTPIYSESAEWTGASAGWVRTGVDLTDAVGPVTVRWVFAADRSGTGGGWFLDDVAISDGDALAPRIDRMDVLSDTEAVGVPQAVTASVRDDVGLEQVTLRYAVDSGAPVELPMAFTDGAYRADLPGQPAGVTVRYAVVAADAEQSSESESIAFRVFLAAPTGLRLDAPRAVGHTLPLAWDPPASSHPVQGYRVLRDGVEVAAVTDPAADVPVTGAEDTFTVVADYAEGEGDPSEPLRLTAAIPSVDALTPAEAWPGDHVRVQLSGQNLLLTDGAVAASLGGGAAVQVGVRDVDSAVLDVTLDVDAAPGPRDLVLDTPSGRTTAAAAFTVRSGADRPRLVEAALDVAQGQEADLVLSYVGDMAVSDPAVDLGPDVVVSGVSAADGTLRLHAAVAGDAALGDRPVEVDDGMRIFDGVTLTVTNGALQGTGCATAPAVPSLWVLALALLGVRRRRG